MGEMSDLHAAATRVIETDANIDKVARESGLSKEDIEWACDELGWE